MSEQYKKAGVDIHAGYEAVARMKSHIDRTKIPGVMGQFGGFGGMFDLSIGDYKEPVLVSGTDGVGTKLLLAIELNKHNTIGIDVVAMCVNDIITSGAKPLFFLDYIACGKVEPEKIESIVSGVSEGCVQGGCALIGGETAEMPGMYRDDEYDIAGFSVGVVEKSEIISGDHIKAGDILIGLPSSGVHSNGFSLIRKIISDENLSLDKVYEGLDKTLGEELLTPTKIYVEPILKLLQSSAVKGMAHITGGGFYENIPRILPTGLGARVNKGSWNIPPIFGFLQKTGNLSEDELYNVFNMGIGMVLVTTKETVENKLEFLRKTGVNANIIGKVVEGEGIEIA
jgi:phosphoribosylformylglycinamidine cyclo-ligase